MSIYIAHRRIVTKVYATRNAISVLVNETRAGCLRFTGERDLPTVGCYSNSVVLLGLRMQRQHACRLSKIQFAGVDKTEVHDRSTAPITKIYRPDNRHNIRLSM